MPEPLIIPPGPERNSFTAELPHAYGGPAGTAFLRHKASDFLVAELIDVPEHSGGAHWWLHVEKTGLNSKDVAIVLSELSNARIRQVGFAGLKDKHAITRQWFSVPIETLDPESLAAKLPDEIKLLDCKRARKSIRRGGLRGNRFKLLLRQFSGERDILEQRLVSLRQGVPNYFGDQRFGINGRNLHHARRLLAGHSAHVPRHERGLYLSAARSYLFNLVLAKRVLDGSWNRLLPGEAINLAGSRSCFQAERGEQAQEILDQRLAEFDIHPSGPLVGMGDSPCDSDCAQLEQEALHPEHELAQGLIDWNLKAERRALRLLPANLEHQWIDGDLELAFSLPKGCFATVVLRECLQAVTAR